MENRPTFLLSNAELVEFLKQYPDFKSPAFQFYPNDFLGSTKVMLMSPDSMGGYAVLLFTAWNTVDCGLPNEDQKLSILSRLGERWFNGCSTEIRPCFFLYEGRLYNRRLLLERKKQVERREKARKAGIESGKARKGKGRDQLDLFGTDVELKPNTLSSSSSPSSFAGSSSNTRKKTGSPDGGPLKKPGKPPALVIDGFAFSGSLLGMISNLVPGTAHDVGRVFYRAHAALRVHKSKGGQGKDFDMVGWILEGLQQPENGNEIPYALKPCKDEDENSGYVKKWIEREILKIALPEKTVPLNDGPEKLSMDAIRKAVPGLRMGVA